jgi:hypothetical protein
MVGPELESDDNGRKFCAFMSNNHVYWAISDPSMNAFTLHISTPSNEQDEIFPTAIPNHSSQVLFLWQVGPMSVSDSAVVKWAIYNTDGSFTGVQGVAGKTSSGTKSTAFVGTDNNFYIIINSDYPVSIQDDLELSNIQIFPNPTHDLLKISGITERTTIQIYNVSGEFVFEKEVFTNTIIDVHKWISGLYEVVIRGDKNTLFRKVLIAE